MNISGRNQPKCRTCCDTTDDNGTFYSLTGKLVKDDQRKTLAEFLWDIAKIDNISEMSKQLPQQICDNCLRKLKATFSFVTQIQKVNREMMAALRSKDSVTSPPTSPENTEVDENENSEIETVDCDYEDSSSNNMRAASEASFNIQEQQRFIDFNTSVVGDKEDPIAVHRFNGSNTELNGVQHNCVHQDCEDSFSLKSVLSTETTQTYNNRSRAATSYRRLKPSAERFMPLQKPQNCEDSTQCKNGCHIEIKSLLYKLMNLQYQLHTKYRTKKRPKEPKSKMFQFAAEKKAQRSIVPEKRTVQKPLEITKNVTQMDSVKSWFPISSIDHAAQVERKLKSGGYTDAVVTYLKGLVNFRGATVNEVLRFIFKDELAEHFNLEGRKGKMSLITYEAIMSCVRTVFADLSTDQFIKNLRRYVLLAHNRITQKKYMIKKRLDENKSSGDEDTQSSSDNTVIEQTLEWNESEFSFNVDGLSEDSIMFDIFDTDKELGRGCSTPKIACMVESNSINTSIPNTLETNSSNCSDDILPELSEADFPQSENSQSAASKNKKLYIISSLFPISTQERVLEIEENLKDPRYADKIFEHIKQLKVTQKGDVDKVLRCMFTDKLISDYNYDGRAGKHSLHNLNLISTHLFNAFSDLRRLGFLKLVRQFIFLSHSRYNNKLYIARKNIIFN